MSQFSDAVASMNAVLTQTFGDSVTYRHYTGVEETISVIWERPSTHEDTASGTLPSIFVDLNQFLQGEPRAGEDVIDGTLRYKVMAFTRDFNESVTLPLQLMP